MGAGHLFWGVAFIGALVLGFFAGIEHSKRDSATPIYVLNERARAEVAAKEAHIVALKARVQELTRQVDDLRQRLGEAEARLRDRGPANDTTPSPGPPGEAPVAEVAPEEPPPPAEEPATTEPAEPEVEAAFAPRETEETTAEPAPDDAAGENALLPPPTAFVPKRTDDSSREALDAGIEAYHEGQYDEAIQHWLAPARQGIPRAQYLLGATLYEGAFEADPAIMLAWLRLAARHGVRPAESLLARVEPEFDEEVIARSRVLSNEPEERSRQDDG